MEQVFKDQFIAAGVDGFNSIKQNQINSQIENIVKDQLRAQTQQDLNFENALIHLSKMRHFLSSPQNILGTIRTKHGEVAEHLEVNVRNAKSTLLGLKNNATFDGVGRTAPEDFLLNGVKIQSKFINGTNNTLSHVFKHVQTYRDSSIDYMIPKDQYAVIEQIRGGAIPESLSAKSAQTILNKVNELESVTGRPFSELCHPSISNYDEVQLGKVFETVTNHHDDLIDQNHEIKQEIDRQAKNDTKSANALRGPSLNEGVKVAGSAAAVTASISLLKGMYTKIKSGKKLSDFDASDWKELGLDAGKSGAKAGITAGSIYTLTNVTSLSAPFAGAVTSAAFGMGALFKSYNAGDIAADEVVTEGQLICFEAGVTAVGAALGQALIPVPVLGAIIGTIATDFIWQFAKGKLGEKEKALKKILDDYSASLLHQIDQAYHQLIARIEATFSRYNSLLDAAFDLEANSASLAAASIELAKSLNVSETKILHNHAELDQFFLS
ncbi:hypothetical protein [Exiguobacterium sp. 17-1]|uniref:hypothetical protein n=1 Tax=Exiguobacterium sp. 17-1 TaxID=2931981 RepID=UPI001FFF1589|nr:hypothetical protein [Exiguobacterium sp. 17-1]MCK2156187.1 hypothetical protein [Exiguobacterium sp. 17-1]